MLLTSTPQNMRWLAGPHWRVYIEDFNTVRTRRTSGVKPACRQTRMNSGVERVPQNMRALANRVKMGDWAEK